MLEAYKENKRREMLVRKQERNRIKSPDLGNGRGEILGRSLYEHRCRKMGKRDRIARLRTKITVKAGDRGLKPGKEKKGTKRSPLLDSGKLQQGTVNEESQSSRGSPSKGKQKKNPI